MFASVQLLRAEQGQQAQQKHATMEIMMAKNTIVPITAPAMLAPVELSELEESLEEQNAEQSPPSQHSSPVPQSESKEQ